MLPKWNLADIRARMFNQPLLVTQDRALAALGVMGPKLDVRALLSGDGPALSIDQLKARAAVAKAEHDGLPGDENLKKWEYDWVTEQVTEKTPYEIWNNCAVFEVRGTLMAENGIDPYSGATGYDGLSRKARLALADPAVLGGILDIDSGGGDVTGLAEAAAHFLAFAAEKPLRAVIRGSGCSAAYYLAACAGPGNITAADYSIVGSIGAIMLHADFSKQLANEGIDVTLITSDDHKADASQFKPLDDAVAAKLKGMVDACASGFIDHVAIARGQDRDAIAAQQAAFASGQEALDLGLVDKFMSWDESMKEFAAIVNGTGKRPAGTAPSGAIKGNAMSANNPAPAAEQPEFTQAALDAAVATATASATATATTAAQTAERERISQLVELDAASTVSPALASAISEGTSAGDFAIGLAKAAKAAGPAALKGARDDAAPASTLPAGTGAAALAAKVDGAEPNRGAAYAAKKAAKPA